MLQNIGSKVRQFRELKGYSQDDMAHLLGITLKTYGNLERDNNKTIDIEKLGKIADLLGVSVEDFFELKNKPTLLAQNGNGDNNHSNSLSIYGTNFTHQDLAHALDKSQMEITHLKEKILFQATEIENLKEIIALMKEKK
jgi:transcriptional regulator with XRE-family HTH domain